MLSQMISQMNGKRRPAPTSGHDEALVQRINDTYANHLQTT
jgi:hypothetical protein